MEEERLTLGLPIPCPFRFPVPICSDQEDAIARIGGRVTSCSQLANVGSQVYSEVYGGTPGRVRGFIVAEVTKALKAGIPECFA